MFMMQFKWPSQKLAQMCEQFDCEIKWFEDKAQAKIYCVKIITVDPRNFSLRTRQLK